MWTSGLEPAPVGAYEAHGSPLVASIRWLGWRLPAPFFERIQLRVAKRTGLAGV
jgi:hypothetical protein